MKANKMYGAIIAGVMLIITAVTTYAALLDGARLKVKVVPEKDAAEKGAKAFDDELIFSNGKCSSTALARKGFTPSNCKVETEPNEAEFEVEMVSTTHDVVVWKGEIRGTNVIGGLQWIQKSGTNLMYEFTGTKE
jgi:hypothetical protein